MDFRIVEMPGLRLKHILLERFQDDDRWQVAISVYMEKESRYDEWEICDSADQARDFIKNYAQDDAYAFMGRAIDWQADKDARLARANA